jgi:aconitate hydratase
MTVAAALKGKRVPPEVALGVACGSRQVLEMASRNGALADIIAAGARILELACGFCIGNSQAPRSNAVSVRTSNRNFFGRSGTNSAQVYLVSPETAVASALNGKLTDPRTFFGEGSYPSIRVPDGFIVNDNMIIPPQPTTASREIYRGPNIGDPPANTMCPESLNGIVAIKVGDKITTDHIMPAGNRLKYRSNIPKYAEYVFEREDPLFAARAAENRNKGLQNIIVAGESYGQGSSREHAAICPMFLGVRMVIAKSIERIHRANLINFGIVPALLIELSDYDSLLAGMALSANRFRKSLETGNSLIVEAGMKSIRLKVDLTERERQMILAGGLINLTRGQGN